jgi:hypothetical protein
MTAEQRRRPNVAVDPAEMIGHLARRRAERAPHQYTA